MSVYIAHIGFAPSVPIVYINQYVTVDCRHITLDAYLYIDIKVQL